MRLPMRRALPAAVCAVLLSLAATPVAQAALDDPLFFYTPQPAPPPAAPIPPPLGYLDGPCGLAVKSNGNIYVSDYYHRAVDVLTTLPGYSSQPLSAYTGAANPHTGPVDDPCGLALDSSGDIYLNNYHRNVVRFPAPISLGTAEVIDTGDPADPDADPTGVAVDPATDHAFVDDRTWLAEYDSTGAFVRKLGEGTLEDGYGIAVSRYPGTPGYLYVPDAASDTVKVYDPSFSTTTPKATISGPSGGFGSLRDSAVAVDNSSGEIYVADTLGPQFTEEPWAVVYVFNAAGIYEGRLKHATIDAAPVGLAVDNSGGGTQGRVYLTSGIGEDASIYGYRAHAATATAQPPLLFGSAAGGGSPSAGGGPSTPSLVAPATSSSAVVAAEPAASTAATGSLIKRPRRDGKRRHASRRRPPRHHRPGQRHR